MRMPSQELTVVIPVRDDVQVERCLRSIDSRSARPLVVMNDPSRQVARLVESSGSDRITLHGVTAPEACERGIWAAASDAVLMMDSDCVFRAGTLDVFASIPEEVLLARGRVVFAHYTRQEAVTAAVRTLHANAPSQVFKVPLLLRKSVAERIGGYFFDQRLTWTEDYDLGQRVAAAGVSVARIPSAVVIHEPLSMMRDLRSGLSYGRGHYEGHRLGLRGYGGFRPSLSGERLGMYRRLADRTTWPIAAYAALFNVVVRFGYISAWMKGVTDGQRTT